MQLECNCSLTVVLYVLIFSSSINPQAAQSMQFPSQQNMFPQNQAAGQEAGGAQDQQEPALVEPPAQPQPVRDPDNQERDWLDQFYVLSRVLVFACIVYFYSSPFRCIFVFLLGFCLYLYQNGVFRNINVNINNNNINNPAEQVVEDNQAPSRLMVAWTFFTTFFASLIPEIPNAV